MSGEAKSCVDTASVSPDWARRWARFAIAAAALLGLCAPIAGVAVEGDGVLDKLRGAGSGVLDKLRGGGETGAVPEFLPVEQAFRISVGSGSANLAVVDLKPAPGYYLYRDKLHFSVVRPAGRVEQVGLPRGELKADPNFGDTHVFHDPVTAMLTLADVPPGAREVVLEVQYQGCADAGLCYPPEKKVLTMAIAAAQADGGAGTPHPEGRPTDGGGGRNAAAEQPADGPGAGEAAVSASASRAAVGGGDEASRIAGLFSSGNFWVILASFFGFGLLLAFTPCMLPMIPILSGIIVGRGHELRRAQGFALSLAYVLGMAITYALAGVAAGLSGTLLAASLQQPWVLAAFAALFVVLALSMFGLYDLQLPTGLQSRLTATSNHMRGGTLGGVFAMGVLSALIVGPCVAAPLAGALLYINKTRDAVLGGSALFSMAVGMGVPLLALGLSAGSLLPKAGPWMRTVKNFFGVLLLGLAIWTVSPVLPTVVTMLSWAALLIVSAIYLHAIDPLPSNASGFRKLWKGLGVISLLLGVALLIGALSGGRDVLQPLSGLRANASIDPSSAPNAPQFARISSLAQLDQAILAAHGRPVMLDFYADWCVSCIEMERRTFTDPAVRERMRKMVLLKADVTANTADHVALLRRFGLFGPPGTVFFDAQGRLLDQRVVGFQDAERFVQSLDLAFSPS